MATAPYRVWFLPAAFKQLAALPRDAQERVMNQITLLGNDPRPHGYEKLKGRSNQYRIRVGDYRVVYSIVDAQAPVLVLRVAHRKDVYRP